MRLVLDTNILVSFFRPNPVQYILNNSESFELTLFTPEHGIDELINNLKSLIKYSGKTNLEVNDLLIELKKYVKVISSEEFENFKESAKDISPHDKDIPFFTLALKLNAAIWSNEPRLKRQSEVKVFSTADLRKLLSL